MKPFSILSFLFVLTSLGAGTVQPSSPQDLLTPVSHPGSAQEPSILHNLEDWSSVRQPIRRNRHAVRLILQRIASEGFEAYEKELNALPFARGAHLSGRAVMGGFQRLAFFTTQFERGSVFLEAKFNEALFIRCHANGVDFEEANMSNALIESGAFTNCSFVKANFTNARLLNVDLSDSDLRFAKLQQARFEPAKLPAIRGIAQAEGLAELVYEHPEALMLLREEFRKAGYNRQAREITVALRRKEQHPLAWLAFDWTCSWGLDWQSPLIVLLILWIGCSFIYWIVIWRPWPVNQDFPACAAVGKVPPNRIWRVPSEHYFRTEPKPAPQPLKESFGKSAFLALAFSALCLLRIGWRDLSLGNWIMRLHPDHIVFRSTGRIRAFAALQSLISVYFIALAVLSYFTEPFGW